MNSLFEELGGTYHQEGITFCPTWLHLKAPLLAYGDNDGGTT